jgi:hypothetical protein
MNTLPFSEMNPNPDDFQFLEDLATGYWYSEVLFAALELGVFDIIASGKKTLSNMTAETGWQPKPLERLLNVLVRIELVGRCDDLWFNSRTAQTYLVTENPDYLGNFLLYRKYMQPAWQTLTDRIRGTDESCRSKKALDSDDYQARNFHYVRAMDGVSKVKAEEISRCLCQYRWDGPVLDVGGGAGALCRSICQRRISAHGILFDLPEVIEAAKLLYPDARDWKRMKTLSGDFRNFEFEPDQKFGLVLMSNFFHIYSAPEALTMMEKALSIMSEDTILAIHDYFPDRFGRRPHKGVLYDMCMLLNTYNGLCQPSENVCQWLTNAGAESILLRDLSTDSSLILAAKQSGRFDKTV